MTQDEVNEMARQAHRKLVTEVYVGHMGQLDPWTIELLKIFAKLVEDAAFKRWAAQTKLAVQDEREACAEKTGELARKWWSIHCASNKHMETTRKAHDDFCALQAAIRARGEA